MYRTLTRFASSVFGNKEHRLTFSWLLALTLFGLLLSLPLQAQPRYSITPLPFSETQAFSAGQVNSNGVVAGTLSTINSPISQAALWDAKNGTQLLGTLGGTSSQASAINDRGVVVGSSDTALGQQHAFVWTRQTGMRDLGTLGGPYSYAVGVNIWGEVIGQSQTVSGEDHAFLWTALTGMQDLGNLIGPYSGVDSINDLGEIAGITRDASGQNFQAFRWTWLHGFQKLGTPAGRSSLGLSINLSGEVCGYTFDASYQVAATLWKGNSPAQNLGTLGGAGSVAYSLNNKGQIVGQADVAVPTGSSPAFLYEHGTMYNLNDLIVPSPHVVNIATYINNKGAILGLGDNFGAYFLLTPLSH